MEHKVYIPIGGHGLDTLKVASTQLDIDHVRNAKAILAWLHGGVHSRTFNATARLLGLSINQLSTITDLCYQDLLLGEDRIG